jgi:hypothetical protein
MDVSAIPESARLELHEILQSIINNVDDLKAIVNMKSPSIVESIMQSIQEVRGTFSL